MDDVGCLDVSMFGFLEFAFWDFQEPLHHFKVTPIRGLERLLPGIHWAGVETAQPSEWVQLGTGQFE